MKSKSLGHGVLTVVTIELLACLWLTPVMELSVAEPSPEKNAENTLEKLYGQQEAAQTLSKQAKAIMVFPNVFKAGFIGGAQYGEGVLFRDGKAEGRYSSVAGSFGLQAGVQVFGYALFFMTDKALEYLERSDGWEIGVGPSIVVVNSGMGKSLTSTTMREDVYAFIFNQQGLMAGLGIQGSKITKIK